jgi:anti-anti-sigma regulatory factor
MGLKFIFDKNILILTFTNNLTETEFGQFKNIFDKHFEMKKPFGIVLNLYDVSSIDTNLIMPLYDYIKKSEENIREYLIASSVVLYHQWIKNIINTFFKIKPPLKPNLITTTEKEAIEYIEDNKELYFITQKKK